MKTAARLALPALVAVVLGAVYFYLARDTDPARTGFMYRFPSGDRLEEMRIANHLGSVQFSRGDDGKWVLTEPGHYRANQQKAVIMEDLLLNLPINRQIDGVAPEYGLDDPQASIDMISTSGIRKSLLIGNLTSSKAQVYLQDKDSGKVFVSDLGSVTQFDGSLDAYRDKDIFSIDKSNIVEFSYYEDGEKKVTAQRRNGQGWRLIYPFESPAREIEINEFLIALRKWSAARYPGREQLDYAALGLDHPPEVLEVVDAKGQKQRLELGAESEGLRFIRSGSQEDIAAVFAVDVDLSHLNPADLLFYQPLHATIGRVASIELTAPDRSVAFELDHTTNPPRVTANGRLIPYEDFVSFFIKYIGLSADGYDADPEPGAETLGLKTTYIDGQTAQVKLLERDSGRKYMQVNDQARFYLSGEKVELLLDRLDAAIAAGQ